MKSSMKVLWAVMAISSAATFKVYAQDQDLGTPNDGPWLFSSRLGAEFTDNRDGTKANKESNLDVYFEPRADYRLRDGERTSLDLAVLPMVKWHSNPREGASAQNDVEVFGTAALELLHQLTERVNVNFGDAITYNDDPEIQNGANVRYSNNHIWNTAHAGVEAGVTEKTSVGLNGSYSVKRYNDSVVAENEDEDIFDVTGNVKYKTAAGYNLLGQAGYSKFENKSTERQRGSSVVSAGAGVEKAYSPDLFAKVTAGYQRGSYDDSTLADINSPNGAAEVTLRGASVTRFRVGASYGLYAPYVRPYSIQTLTAFNAAVDHDVVSHLTVTLSGQYGRGHYKSEGASLPGGNDDLMMATLGATYKVNRTWSVAAGYSIENWDSDVRESFTRNSVNVGVKAEL